MLRHLRSAPNLTSPPPPATATAEGEKDEEDARALGVSDQRTLYLVNMFIANTVDFLNSFSSLCNNKLSLLRRRIVKLDASLTLLETKLQSIEDTSPSKHSTSQKATESLAHDKRSDPVSIG